MGAFVILTASGAAWAADEARDAGDEAPARSRGRRYGVEVDTEFAYRATDWFTARIEGDALLPGSFYRSALAPDPEPVYKLVVGGDVSW